MNPRVIEICDSIVQWWDISSEDFKFLKAYIFACNKFKWGDSDDVFSNFLLDVKKFYDPWFETKQKEVWIYAHIKKAMSDMARFDKRWLLYNPVPVALGTEIVEIISTEEDTPSRALETAEWQRLIESLKEIIRDWFEMDIYVYCVIWDSPVSVIASQWWKSAERWRVTKDKVLEKLKLYIENYR